MRPGLLALLALLGASAPQAEAQQPPRRVILFIGDGVGTAYWSAARFAADALAVQRFRVIGLVDTRSSDSDITDSAAGATAYAAGIRTFNGAIGVGPDSQAVKTVLEVARDRGWATGLVATSSITHATPASFAAHVNSRASEFEIAKQMIDARVDVLLGGGTRYFDRAFRPDSQDLLARLRSEYTYITRAEELARAQDRSVRRLAGLFASTQMSSARTRSPTLPDMTRAALDVLSRDPDGFFLMVEGSQPDWRGHSNEPLDAVTGEMLDFDRAIGVGLDYQQRNPGTLVVVVADHETGGLALDQVRDSTALMAASQAIQAAMERMAQTRGFVPDSLRALDDSAWRQMAAAAGRMRARAAERGRRISLTATYTTTGHTAEMVPLFAAGPMADRFGGIIDNHRVGQLLLEIVGKR
ncbi:MAG TPA: alkaline phosphatase [Gemmatimonadales bacterium]|nr:alkaline phosphatase [Gemmatimonadales bacterium]